MKIVVHYVVEAVVDFTYGRLRNPAAIDALPYIVERLKEAVARNATNGINAPAITIEVDKEVHVFMFQRDRHPADESDFLKTPEGEKFPFFHCPEGDPGMEVVDELKVFNKYTHRSSPADKPYIFDPITIEAIQDIEVDYGQIDEIHFYGFLTGMCLLGAAILARAFFQEAEIFVHSSGTADCDRLDFRGNLRTGAEWKEMALTVLGGNFINIVE